MPRDEKTDDRTSRDADQRRETANGRESADAQQRADAQSESAAANGSTGRRNRLVEWLASTTVWVGVGAIGVVLLLFALGQAVGIPLLSMAAEAVTSQTGRWLVVAAFALALIGLAERGISTYA